MIDMAAVFPPVSLGGGLEMSSSIAEALKSGQLKLK